MFALSKSLSAHLSSNCSVGIVDCSFLRYFIVFQNCFLFPLLMFLAKNDCLEFFNIDVTLFRILLYFLHSSVDPDDLALLNKLFRFALHVLSFLITMEDFYVLVECTLGYTHP